jgi:glycosyltransferase involved in cell wall biosynthesis
MSAAATPEAPTIPFEPLPQFRQNPFEESAERANNGGKRIGVLIVAYNALTTLSKVLKRITPEVWANVEQVVIFDDASKDSTYELALGIQAHLNIPKLHVLRNSKNLGYGGNQKVGYRYFIEQGFDIAVMLHGDAQYAPELLSHMYSPLVRAEADAVFGSRMMKAFGGPLKGGMPLYKYLGNRILTLIENKALGLNLTEFHSGYRAYNLHALNKIRLDNMTDDFHFDTEIIIKLHHQNFRIVEVPIPTFYGDEVCNVNGMRYATDVVRSVYRYTSTARAVRSYPEYAEYFVPYAIKRSPYSTHFYAALLTGKAQEVLELSCGDGAFGSELVRAGNRVTGVDSHPMVPGWAGYCDVIGADLENGLPEFRNAPFSRVLLIDTIEHLRDPRPLLRDVKRAVADRGMVIIAVPNVANLAVRLTLLFGRFRYGDRGILDWSHLRFFTRKTIAELLQTSGFGICDHHYTIIPVERLIPLGHDHWFMRFLMQLLRMATRIAPGLLAYEVVLVAEPADEASHQSSRAQCGPAKTVVSSER